MKKLFNVGDRVLAEDFMGQIVGTIKGIHNSPLFGNIYVIEKDGTEVERRFFESELTKLAKEEKDMNEKLNANASINIELPEGLKGIDINILAQNKDLIAKIVAEYEDEETKKIDDSGYIQELESRWIPAEFFELVYGGRYYWDSFATNMLRKYGYLYQITFFIGHGANKGELMRMHRDYRRARTNGKFFTKDLILKICDDVIDTAVRYVKHRPIRGKYKGQKYIRLGATRGTNYLDVIVEPHRDQREELIYAPLRRQIELIRRCKDDDYYGIRKHLVRFYEILTRECFLGNIRDDFCKEFVDAFKGNGAYHAIRDLIRDPKKRCVIRLKPMKYVYGLDQADKLYSKPDEKVVLNAQDSLDYLEIKTMVTRPGDFYRLLGLYKEMVEYNNFDMKEHLKYFRHVAK